MLHHPAPSLFDDLINKGELRRIVSSTYIFIYVYIIHLEEELKGSNRSYTTVDRLKLCVLGSDFHQIASRRGNKSKTISVSSGSYRNNNI